LETQDIHWKDCEAIERTPERVSGAWVFVDTRVPVAALFENLRGGATVDEFVDWFPGVTKTQVLNVLRPVRINFFESASRS
jgi:uncharacterized protein (DUF433 family)